MATNVIVVTPSPNFGESIRSSLEETGEYRVFSVSSKASAIVRADEESCKMAFLDLEMGEAWVEDVAGSLRTVLPDIKLFILAQDETPPALDSIRPWTLVRKPLQLPQLLRTLSGRPAPSMPGSDPVQKEPDHSAWLSDVSKAAQHLTRLTLESSSQAALIARNNEVWAYAGQLSQEAAREIVRVMVKAWEAGKGGDLLRFVRLESTKADHMLYATELSEGMLLALVFDAETPFSTIRSQANQLTNSLSGGEPPRNEEPRLSWPKGTRSQTGSPLASEVSDDDEIDLPLITDILTDIPAPNPEMDSPLNLSFTETEMDADRPLDPGETRRSIFSGESSPPIPVNDLLNSRKRASELDETRVSQSEARPRTPVRGPMPGELNETRPQGKSKLPGHIVLEPATAGVYHLTYACLLVPRLTTHYLTGDIADRLSEWLADICISFGWRLEHIAVRPEYLQWVVNVPPATSPGRVMRVVREQTSEKIFVAFPRLKRENPSGDFWAPGYLIMGGSQPHPAQLVKDYIKQIRQRQGIENR